MAELTCSLCHKALPSKGGDYCALCARLLETVWQRGLEDARALQATGWLGAEAAASCDLDGDTQCEEAR